ncbi:MAG: hypothetical protein H0T73_14240 [Ardenticatenales bacterium]|nr:hypothetical protein [Ardenticatenales bacterium]
MTFSFDLATPDDDAAIRRLLATNPVPGHITLNYEREPAYFAGCGTMGHFWQVLVAREEATGRIVGLACRATRPLFVNGRVEEVGYLSQLRVDKDYRGRWLVAKGFHKMHALHDDGRVRGYLATIIEENREAQGILVERPRRHFPAFREVTKLATLAILLRRHGHCTPSPCEIRSGGEVSLGEIVAFLREHGAQRQFFPVYSNEDFEGSSLTLGFCNEDFAVACRGSSIVGVMGLWDQSAYKQMVVQGYSGTLRWARPLINGVARLFGAPSLPAPGRALSFVYASFLCIAGNDPAVFQTLLERLYQQAAVRGYSFLMLALSAADPLLPVAQQYAHIPYHSRLYTVCWEDGERFHHELDQRLPAIEIAAL